MFDSDTSTHAYMLELGRNAPEEGRKRSDKFGGKSVWLVFTTSAIAWLGFRRDRYVN